MAIGGAEGDVGVCVLHFQRNLLHREGGSGSGVFEVSVKAPLVRMDVVGRGELVTWSYDCYSHPQLFPCVRLLMATVL